MSPAPNSSPALLHGQAGARHGSLLRQSSLHGVLRVSMGKDGEMEWRWAGGRGWLDLMALDIGLARTSSLAAEGPLRDQAHSGATPVALEQTAAVPSRRKCGSRPTHLSPTPAHLEHND